MKLRGSWAELRVVRHLDWGTVTDRFRVESWAWLGVEWHGGEGRGVHSVAIAAAVVEARLRLGVEEVHSVGSEGSVWFC